MKREFAIFLVCLAFLFVSCDKEISEVQLVKDFTRLDSFLRGHPFKYDSLKIFLAGVERNLAHSENRKSGSGVWSTSVTYKWNSDSSLVCIYASKTFRVGFSREVIIHSGDSVLFIHRFSTEPLGQRRRDDYSFLESVNYLNQTGTIKHLLRTEHWKKDLKDTLGFRTKPFVDVTEKLYYDYSLELDYSQNLLTVN